MADQKSQRVEAILSNLTQNTSPALIHFAGGQTQQTLMVRMPETIPTPEP